MAVGQGYRTNAEGIRQLGDDVVWLDRNTLAVGQGYRTNAEGIRQLGELVGPDVEVVTVTLPHFRGPAEVFHLMSIVSLVDHDLAVVYSPLMPVPFPSLPTYVRHRARKELE